MADTGFSDHFSANAEGYSQFRPDYPSALFERLAVWAYDLLRIEPALDALVDHLYHEVLGPWWPAERRLVERCDADLPMPVTLVISPFRMTARWRYADLMGYLQTWSATGAYRAERGQDPVAPFAEDIAAAWGVDDDKTVTWELTVLSCRHEDVSG